MWILFVILARSGSGSAMLSQEFSGRASCEAARATMYAERERLKMGGKWSAFRMDSAFCVEK